LEFKRLLSSPSLSVTVKLDCLDRWAQGK